MACKHIATRHPDRGPVVAPLKLETLNLRYTSDHYWCENCVEDNAIVSADLSAAGYRDLSKNLRPVCAACLEWLGAN